MKLFYDENGTVVGQIEGATPEIEAMADMPGLNSIRAPRLVRDIVADPFTDMTHNDLAVVGEDVILKDFGISLSEAPQPQTPDLQDESPQP